MTDDISKVVPPVHAATFVPSFSEAARCLGMAQAQGKRHAIAHWQGIVDAHETAAKAALRLESATAPVEVGGAKPIAEVTEGFSDAFGGAAPVARWMGKAPSLGTTLYSHDDYATLARQLSDSEASRREAEASLAEAKAENERLMTIAGWGGLAGDAPERLILASEAYDDISCCDKWIDVRRVTDGEQPIPASATAYVRANLHEQAESQLAEATRRLGEVEGLVGKWRELGGNDSLDVYYADGLRACADELEQLTKEPIK